MGITRLITMESEADFRKEELKRILARLGDNLYSVQRQQDKTGRSLSDRDVERCMDSFQNLYDRAQVRAKPTANSQVHPPEGCY